MANGMVHVVKNQTRRKSIQISFCCLVDQTISFQMDVRRHMISRHIGRQGKENVLERDVRGCGQVSYINSLMPSDAYMRQ